MPFVPVPPSRRPPAEAWVRSGLVPGAGDSASPPIPFVPLRFSLYTRAELFAGFDPAAPASFAATVDFAIYRHFVLEGGRGSPTHRFTSMMQALHDHSITEAVAPILANRAVAAVMGGHRLRRDSAP